MSNTKSKIIKHGPKKEEITHNEEEKSMNRNKLRYDRNNRIRKKLYKYFNETIFHTFK